MKSTPDIAGSGRGSRRTEADSNKANEGVGNSRTIPTDRHPKQIITKPWASNDESLDDEQFLSPSSVPGGTSWESQSFDDDDRGQGGRPDSRTSSTRERRKRFDSTTPTLVDEEDVPDSIEEVGEADGVQIPQPSASLDLSRDESLVRPIDEYALRRTPGAAQMHQSVSRGVTSPTDIGDQSKDARGNASVLASTGRWQSASNDSVSSAPSQSKTSASTPAHRKPVPSGVGTSRSEAQGPYAFASWTKNTPAASGERHGAFSPNILRLTEDIGNLLQEDEDDDYAIEIPSVFRGGEGEDKAASAGVGGDWTGSYNVNVFDSKLGGRSRGGSVHRPSTTGKDGRTRRRSHTSHGSSGSGGYATSSQRGIGASGFQAPASGSSTSFFPVAMQPKPEPRRSGNEVFEFGKQSNERSSPQLFSFGGAFVPPSKDVSGSYMRPVASTPAPSFEPPPFQQQSQSAASVRSVPQGPTFGMQPPVFQSYQPPAHQPGVPVASSSFVPPANVPSFQAPLMAPPQGPSAVQYQGRQPSEMQASAQEFVPMKTRSPAPQFMGSQPQWQPPRNFEQSLPPSQLPATQANWHSAASTSTNFHGNSGFNVPPSAPPVGYAGESVRSAMTPSPRVTSWQPPQPQQPLTQPDPSTYGVQSTTEEVVTQAAVMTHSPPIVTTQISSPSPDFTQLSRSKKPSSRNTRRNKKKNPKTEKSLASTPSRKKGRDSTRPGPTTLVAVDGTVDEAVVSVPENPLDAKRAELEETPATRIAFKEFYRGFRMEERQSFQKAEEFAQKALTDGSLPESIHWRVYLELADLARRSNRYVESRGLYQKACQLQPFASQGWLEYSKLEEDCGFMNRVSNILHAGLEYCEYSETLLTRAVKHQEKMGNLSSARGILARLKHVGIDKVWRTVLEGALLEARAGNHHMARRVLKYLMHHVPWYGPLYLEAYKLERDQGHPMDAMLIVERGLTTLPRYGPLWFGAFRLYEEMDVTEGQFHLPRTMHMIERAKSTISKELVWKLHLEAAHMLERTALAYVEESDLDLVSYLKPVRRRLVLTILTCPQNLRWKVWLAAGRMELVVGNSDLAHTLFKRAHHCVQQKSKSATLLDCSRLAEFTGDVQLARGILTKARSFYCSDWKVWFESVLVEIRNNNHAKGYDIAARGLELHTGSGRLWATLVQLGQLVGGDELQTAALKRALRAVPKSGEVWCEGARIHLNPFSCTFDLHRSRRYLHFAARFTPQFGDSFIESIRLEVLSQWLLPIADYIWTKTRGCFTDDQAEGRNLSKYVADVYLAIAVARRGNSDEAQEVPETKFRDIVSTLRKKLQVDNLRSSIDLTDLRLACTNADPNYGSLWFHCRRLPMYTPRRVIEHAADDVADEIFRYANIYLAAMIRRMAVLATMERRMPHGAESDAETSDPDIVNWENSLDKELRRAVSLQLILDREDPTTGLVLLESAMQGSVFITGLSELNRHKPLGSMTLLERRRALFGTDALFP